MLRYMDFSEEHLQYFEPSHFEKNKRAQTL